MSELSPVTVISWVGASRGKRCHRSALIQRPPTPNVDASTNCAIGVVQRSGSGRYLPPSWTGRNLPPSGTGRYLQLSWTGRYLPLSGAGRYRPPSWTRRYLQPSGSGRYLPPTEPGRCLSPKGSGRYLSPEIGYQYHLPLFMAPASDLSQRLRLRFRIPACSMSHKS